LLPVEAGNSSANAEKVEEFHSPEWNRGWLARTTRSVLP